MNPHPEPHKENLRPPRTSEEARTRGKAGGIKSGKVRREKKFMSMIYADILAEKSGLKSGLSLKTVVKTILKIGGSPAVSMLREIREATEGSKVKLTGTQIIYADEQDRGLSTGESVPKDE